MTQRDKIHDYLTTLSTYLARLEKTDSDEVIKEIESHIYDALDAQGYREGDKADIDAILDGFGTPRDLASSYVDHILSGSPPPKGFRAIQSVKKGASKGLYYATAIFGYMISAILVFLALYKPFAPDAVGLWSDGSGNSFVIGIIDGGPEGTTDLLGWWLIPAFIAVGIACAYFTKRLLSALKLNIQ
ncbi:hypothetical protein [Kordiimonas sp. SCSIO 12610]|uniref:HAAS signaling domain-containing protein n=1 Tax=Kordiimonas sp. SCSIO 12610 TaxID=2829597 RepID=UPI00210C678F|nr:hypothetical protein [Kordiimonas sp. SCSIO 12610]UTW53816.1 hypothetical protein KFF44_08140 [Kordiimonas sp. SCSIO 12610]